MNKKAFTDFYNKVIRSLATRLIEENTQFVFFDKLDAVYEEYQNQKALMRVLYQKEFKDSLLDRHKVCACVTVAIIKVRPLSSSISLEQEDYKLSHASRVNEQLAFLSAWTLFEGFLAVRSEKENVSYSLPVTYHDESFLDTFTRSLFFANQMNGLSTPLLANIFFLLEKTVELS